MATYRDYNPKVNNDYMTPETAWDDIKEYIPKDKIIWEAFYGDGESGKYLESLGFDVIHEDEDFFKNNKGDIVVSNPPFETKKQIIERLVKIDKPFILLLPVSTLCYNYAKILKDNIQIMIPPKRIKFKRYNKITHEIEKDWAKYSSTFDCLWFCYKIGLESDIIYL